MQADKYTLKQLFQKDIRYVIPLFQRPYVWDQESQWDPLWEDVRNLAERYLDAMRQHGGIAAKAESEAGSHFMGAVVLQQVPTAVSEIEQRNVIDGQQRLTTLQILLDAAQEVFESTGHVLPAKRMAKLVLNDEDFAEGDLRFKLWPTSSDQDAFRAAMDNANDDGAFASSQIVKAHQYFRDQISHWVTDGYEGSGENRADALNTVLAGLLELVVIDLRSGDDAYVIFETLNARGTPLLASDLVKNFTLQQADTQGLPAAQMEGRWSEFARDWWREDIRQGRIVRPRIDIFLNYWLIARTRGEVASQEVFPAFKAYVASCGQPVSHVIDDMVATAATYRELDGFPRGTVEESFLYRWKTMQAGVITPLLLELFGAPPEELPRERRTKALRAVESFLIRRMACRLTSKDYNRLFLELLSQLEGRLSEADDVVVEFLKRQTAEARLWPDDTSLREALVSLPLYRMLTRGRLRLLLEGLEDALRSDKAEQGSCPRDLTVEHILPQQWRDNWPLEEEDPERYFELAAEREVKLHTLGNLTLVTGKLNPALSNGPWDMKQKGLLEHSTLFLNKRLIQSTHDEFLEGEIEARGAELAAVVAGVWPHTDGFS